MPLRDRFEKYIEYIRITEANKIARRYFVMNSFDGAVTILGVLLGVLFGGIQNPVQIVNIGIATGIALMISGFTGTVIAEEAERRRDIKALEESMLMDLKDSLYARAARFTTIYVSIVDGLSPFVSIVISISPLLLSIWGYIDEYTALLTSITVCILYLGVIGIFIGEYTGRNKIFESLKLMGIGILTTLLVSLVLQPISNTPI